MDICLCSLVPWKDRSIEFFLLLITKKRFFFMKINTSIFYRSPTNPSIGKDDRIRKKIKRRILLKIREYRDYYQQLLI
tara:strand:- start:7764 stop:7997 length:234 start_codon:yes stop_codon:yes gene_type:complete